MSLHTIGSDARYILPASYDSVPEQFRSNKSAKPIPCSLQTVNLPAMSGDQSLGGTSLIQLPCGASAGYMCNPYLRFTVSLSGTAVKDGVAKFKGSAGSATMAINRLATFVNSQMVQHLQHAWSIYDALLSHSTSQPWLENDGSVMVGSGTEYKQESTAGNATYPDLTFAVPLIGLLGSQQAIPLYLINGTLQIQVDWQSAIGSFLANGGTAHQYTACSFKNVALVYDKISCEQAFVDSVRADMMKGNKFVVGYTNYQTTALATAKDTANATFNYGINVSSLRGVIMTQHASLSDQTNLSVSQANGLNQFRVSLDGRLISNLNNDSAQPALVFAELQKTMGRLFGASISEPVAQASLVATKSALEFPPLYVYNSTRFAVGANCQRVNEGLAFSGTPCSVVSIQYGGATAAISSFIHFISDFQLLITADGSVEIVR